MKTKRHDIEEEQYDEEVIAHLFVDLIADAVAGNKLKLAKGLKEWELPSSINVDDIGLHGPKLILKLSTPKGSRTLVFSGKVKKQ